MVFDYDGEVSVERVDLDPLFTTVYGRRAARACRTTMKPYQPGIDRPVLWVLGTVVEARPAKAAGDAVPGAPAKPARGSGKLARAARPLVLASIVPDLAHTEVRGTA